MVTEEQKKIFTFLSEHRFSKLQIASIIIVCQFVSERLESDVGSLVYEYQQNL